MSTTLLYGLVLAVIQILVTLAGYFLGFQTDRINQGTWFGLVPVVVSLVVLILGIKAVREENEGKYLSFGRGVGAGMTITLYASILGALYTFIHFTYVNPEFPDYLIEASRVKWAAMGMDESKMEGAEKGMRMFVKPAVQAAMALIGGLVFGLIFSLIISAFVKRPAPESAQS